MNGTWVVAMSTLIWVSSLAVELVKLHPPGNNRVVLILACFVQRHAGRRSPDPIAGRAGHRSAELHAFHSEAGLLTHERQQRGWIRANMRRIEVKPVHRRKAMRIDGFQ